MGQRKSRVDRASTGNKPIAAALVGGLLAVAATVPARAHDDDHRGGDDDRDHHPRTQLACDDTMKSEFRTDSKTSVLLVKAFKKGDSLALPDTPATPPPPVATSDVCL